jgi:Fe-S cluster assembly iron-binding protein IscA
MLQIEEKKSVVDKNLQVTERAALQITNLMERDEREGCFLRIRVLGGGCSGM